MTEILSNLVGETVEVSSVEYGGSGTHPYINARGVVRAVYMTERSGMCVVIENAMQDPAGRLCGYDMYTHAVRAVRKCALCDQWDHPSMLDPVSSQPWNPYDGEGPPEDPDKLVHRKFRKGCRENG